MFSEEQSGGNSQKKRKYTHFTPQHRAKIAKYSSECGNTAVVRHFSKDFPFLGESTVSICNVIFLLSTFEITIYCLFHELISNIIAL